MGNEPADGQGMRPRVSLALDPSGGDKTRLINNNGVLVNLLSDCQIRLKPTSHKDYTARRGKTVILTMPPCVSGEMAGKNVQLVLHQWTVATNHRDGRDR